MPIKDPDSAKSLTEPGSSPTANGTDCIWGPTLYPPYFNGQFSMVSETLKLTITNHIGSDSRDFKVLFPFEDEQL